MATLHSNTLGRHGVTFSEATTVADAGAITSVVAAGANPTKAEYDALRVDVIALRTKLNELLDALQALGLA